MNLKTLSIILISGFIITSSLSYANASTIEQYCINGICKTNPLPNIPSNYTHTITKIPILLVSYSQSCQTMIKANIPGCLPLSDIISYDTSNQDISGKFVLLGDHTIRTDPQLKNHWLRYINQKNITVCIDCIMDIPSTQESQNIILQPSSYSFVDKNANIVKDKYSYLNNRYMQGCDTATISSNLSLLNDTIHYMLSGCKVTNYDGNVTKTVHVSPWDYDNPYSTLHQQSYLKDIMHNHNSANTNHTSGGFGPTDCIRHICNFKDPYSNSNW
jgi:hypothetical protein